MKALTVPAPMAGPAQWGRAVLLVEEAALHELDEGTEGSHHLAIDGHGAVPAGVASRRRARHVVDDHRVLLAVVLRVGEEERQEFLPAELLERPEERRHPGPGWRHRAPVGVAPAGRGEEGHAGERTDGQAHPGCSGPWRSSRRWFGRSSQSRSSPFTLKTRPSC